MRVMSDRPGPSTFTGVRPAAPSGAQREENNMTTFAAPTGPALNYDGSVRGHIDPTAYVGSKNVYVASTARVSDGA